MDWTILGLYGWEVHWSERAYGALRQSTHFHFSPIASKCCSVSYSALGHWMTYRALLFHFNSLSLRGYFSENSVSQSSYAFSNELEGGCITGLPMRLVDLILLSLTGLIRASCYGSIQCLLNRLNKLAFFCSILKGPPTGWHYWSCLDDHENSGRCSCLTMSKHYRSAAHISTNIIDFCSWTHHFIRESIIYGGH